MLVSSGTGLAFRGAAGSSIVATGCGIDVFVMVLSFLFSG
jgi:hypothetical protein